jgi:hypothetical protein
MRLEKGLSEMNQIINKYIKSSEEKSEALRNIYSLSKSLEHTSLKLDQADNEDFKMSKKSQAKNNELFFQLYDKNKTYCNILENKVQEDLKVIY